MPAANKSENQDGVDRQPFSRFDRGDASKPTSVAVSNPSPNSTPMGYIFQLRSAIFKSGRKNRPTMPRPSSIRSSVRSLYAPPLRTSRRAVNVRQDHDVDGRDEQQKCCGDRGSDQAADALEPGHIPLNGVCRECDRDRQRDDDGRMTQRRRNRRRPAVCAPASTSG